MPTLTTRICGTCPHAHHLVVGQGARPRVLGAAAAGGPAAAPAPQLRQHDPLARHPLLRAGGAGLLPAGRQPGGETQPGGAARGRARADQEGAAPAQHRSDDRRDRRWPRHAPGDRGGGRHVVRARQGQPRHAQGARRRGAGAGQGGPRRRQEGACSRIPELLRRLPLATNDMGTVRGKALDLYDGTLRVRKPDGSVLARLRRRRLRPAPGRGGAAVQLRQAGPAQGAAAPRSPTAWDRWRGSTAPRSRAPRSADAALAEWKATCGNPSKLVVAGHWARLVELLHCAEKAVAMLDDEAILSPEVRTAAGRASSATPWPTSRPRAACSSTTTTWTATRSSRRPTSWSPPSTTSPASTPPSRTRPAGLLGQERQRAARRRRVRHPLLRPVPVLFHPSRGADAAGGEPLARRPRPADREEISHADGSHRRSRLPRLRSVRRDLPDRRVRGGRAEAARQGGAPGGLHRLHLVRVPVPVALPDA